MMLFYTTTALLICLSTAALASDPTKEDPKQVLQTSRVLVVDDDKLGCLLVATRVRKKSLDQGIPLEVETVTDPILAVELARTKPFDIIVTDLNMPQMNGDEVARRIKNFDSRRKPVMILNTTQEDAETTYAGQFDAVIFKKPERVASAVCVFAKTNAMHAEITNITD